MKIFVEKKPGFQTEVNALISELNKNLNINVSDLRIVNVYDIDNLPNELFEAAKYKVFADFQTDNISFDFTLDEEKYVCLSCKLKNAQKRIQAVNSCLSLFDPNQSFNVKVAKMIIIDKNIEEKELKAIKQYLELSTILKENTVKNINEENDVLDGFINLTTKELDDYCKKMNLAMNKKDLKCVLDYFKSENRNPTLVELRLIDTYWSDHCRHTTFNTKITDIQIDRSFFSFQLEEALDLYKNVREDLKRENRKVNLMDMATIGSKYLKRIGKLNDLEKTGESNAYSIKVNVDVDGKNEKWSLQFKNETSNHPTEVDPYNGAANCIGGTMRDILASRAKAYQAVRVSGAANIYEDPKNTLLGKIPQRIISTKAAAGFADYSNKTGVATTYVKEIYHSDYVAKRLESSLIVGANKTSDIRREKPKDGDFILLVGNKTQKEGVGSAIDSSHEHTDSGLKDYVEEFQHSNPATARKLNNLFRRPEVLRLIKKANDLGAGGIGVGVGELSTGVEIWLDDVLTTSDNLSTLDILLSETQERIALVVSPEEKDELINYINEEELFVSYVGRITSTNDIVIYHKGNVVGHLSRKFIDSAGALRYAEAVIGGIENKNPFYRNDEPLVDRVFNTLGSDNVLSQKGLVELFDSTIGRSTVVLPFGGKYRRTEAQVSAQKLPVKGETHTVSLVSYGFNPELTKWSPYHGASYAIIEALSKLVASGAYYKNARLSFQEYFEKMNSAESWGKAIAALLGALKTQLDFKIPSIGGKDSMAGTYNDRSVPPTFIAYGVTTCKDKQIITPEFKSRGHKLYLVKHQENKDFSPNIEQLIDNFEFIKYNIEKGHIVSAYALGFGGLIEACAKMSMGNSVGFYLNVKEEELNRLNYGSIICEVQGQLEIPEDTNPNFVRVGRTSHVQFGVINGVKFSIPSMIEANYKKYTKVFNNSYDENVDTINIRIHKKKVNQLKNKEIVNVYIPSFRGTNCDEDTVKAFIDAGGNVTSTKFKDETKEALMNSVNEMAWQIGNTDILVLAGGFSADDEPDGAGKYVANILNTPKIKDAINSLLGRKGLILGICNGFQALIKSGLLPYGNVSSETPTNPTFITNRSGKHISRIVELKVMSNASPWLTSYKGGEEVYSSLSCTDGRLVLPKKVANDLIRNGQVAFAYIDPKGDEAKTSEFNPTGSDYAIESIISKDGLVLGKMTHPERYKEGLYKNINNANDSEIFANAINYFKKQNPAKVKVRTKAKNIFKSGKK